MEIRSYINNDVLPVLPNYPIKMIAGMFSSCTNSHIPVVEENKLLGNISEEDMQAFDPDKRVSDYLYALDLFFVTEKTLWVDVLEAFARNNANVMPVLDSDGNYLGFYDLVDIVGIFKDTPFLNESGGVLVIEKGKADYSFSEIAQIVESNDGRLLGAFISDLENDRVQVTLKIASSGLNEILQTFRRYNYQVISEAEDDRYIESLRQRSDYLRRYLDI
ncbi:CBS domain-containing protein [Robertkochia aurantiaca]|uniref:CBS domain-containing protein n=1 Tax=Robertkochia aurantiaca TaxID=2873700 RepID=UPI001CCE5CAF|nr:CBS domain-containing protein [Robertkochia sp. 3YJGBD-33]